MMTLNPLRRTGTLLSFAAVLLLCFPVVFRAQQDAAEVYRRSRHSVVLIEGDHHIGSGVIVPGGCPLAASCSVAWVVTNYHVISGENAVTAKFASGIEVRTTDVVASDPDSDLAILKLTGGPFTQSELGDSDNLAVGQRIIVISNPMGLHGSVTEGLVSAFRQIRGRTMLQISAPISSGSSGGPVFDQQGRVIGIATATIQGGQNLNLAVPSSTIRSLLRSPQAAKLADLSPPGRNDRADGVLAILRSASAYLANEMTAEVEALLRRGIQQYEFDPILRLELSKLLIRTGRGDEALQQLRIVTKLAPDDRQPIEMMGHLYITRWLRDGKLPDWQAAYHMYSNAINERAPTARQWLDFVLKTMQSPAGDWVASGGRHQYSVHERADGTFSVGFTQLLNSRIFAVPANYLSTHYAEFFAGNAR